MVTGGVPCSLFVIEKGLSATQNIVNLAFKRNSFLLNDLSNLYKND